METTVVYLPQHLFLQNTMNDKRFPGNLISHTTWGRFMVYSCKFRYVKIC